VTFVFRDHQLWIERELLAQIEWKAKKEKEEREKQKQVNINKFPIVIIDFILSISQLIML
jgi:hypothetical protein